MYLNTFIAVVDLRAKLLRENAVWFSIFLDCSMYSRKFELLNVKTCQRFHWRILLCDVKNILLLFTPVMSVSRTSAKKAGNSFCRWEAAVRTEVMWLTSWCTPWDFFMSIPDQIEISLSRYYGITSREVSSLKQYYFCFSFSVNS